ncbi:phage tail protein [Escherichia coli]|uniref:phage tail protein n=1 Tax=Escherichia coli TaxID=562 RepID=UPI0022263683|nr:phage tail protein [Escherichia coli]MCW3235036.1 phage tail protein [Escherichia coli]
MAAACLWWVTVVFPARLFRQLKNGRWHVMQRVAGKNRYPIDVVKIPMAVPLTTRRLNRILSGYGVNVFREELDMRCSINWGW